MARKKKDVMLLSPLIENETLPEELKETLEETQQKFGEKVEIPEEDTEERTDIDFLEETDEIEEDIFDNIKIKEVKYSFSVLTNIGNFENIRTQIEVGAEIENNEDMLPCIDALSRRIKDWGRREYKDIKRKSMNGQNQIK